MINNNVNIVHSFYDEINHSLSLSLSLPSPSPSLSLSLSLSLSPLSLSLSLSLSQTIWNAKCQLTISELLSISLVAFQRQFNVSIIWKWSRFYISVIVAYLSRVVNKTCWKQVSRLRDRTVVEKYKNSFYHVLLMDHCMINCLLSLAPQPSKAENTLLVGIEDIACPPPPPLCMQ